MRLPRPTIAAHSAIANHESLSLLEVEMRKLEAVVKEIVDELGYLQRREMRMRDTNGASASGHAACGTRRLLPGPRLAVKAG